MTKKTLELSDFPSQMRGYTTRWYIELAGNKYRVMRKLYYYQLPGGTIAFSSAERAEKHYRSGYGMFDHSTIAVSCGYTGIYGVGETIYTAVAVAAKRVKEECNQIYTDYRTTPEARWFLEETTFRKWVDVG